jgi:hypothetical protein
MSVGRDQHDTSPAIAPCPDLRSAQAGARRSCQVGRRADLFAYCILAMPHLDGFEQDGIARSDQGPALVSGFNAAVKELRRRCACVHSGHCDPPDTRLRREFLVPRQRAPFGRLIPTTISVPPCSGLSRRGLETTEREAKGRATAGSPCARRVQHVWSGRRNGLPSRTKKLE